MDDSISAAGKHSRSKTPVQLSLRLPEAEANSEWEIVSRSVELAPAVQYRIKIIQQLLAARGSDRYAKVQQQAARILGISVRSLRRLVKSWQEHGISGLSRQMRSDQGAAKTSPEWQQFIIKTYRGGNRGSRRLSPAQVGVWVAKLRQSAK